MAKNHCNRRRSIVGFIWGGLIVVVGIFLFVSAVRKSEFVIYKLLTARSRILWKEHVHKFYTVVGILVIAFGIFVALGVVGK
jgi:divalent metal cation (Fe/Co/Zn/Cd) transporter